MAQRCIPGCFDTGLASSGSESTLNHLSVGEYLKRRRAET
jgi:hypothetical protein